MGDPLPFHRDGPAAESGAAPDPGVRRLDAAFAGRSGNRFQARRSRSKECQASTGRRPSVPPIRIFSRKRTRSMATSSGKSPELGGRRMGNRSGGDGRRLNNTNRSARICSICGPPFPPERQVVSLNSDGSEARLSGWGRLLVGAWWVLGGCLVGAWWALGGRLVGAAGRLSRPTACWVATFQNDTKAVSSHRSPRPPAADPEPPPALIGPRASARLEAPFNSASTPLSRLKSVLR